eukprot:UN26247
MVPDNVDASSCQSSCALSMTAEVLKSESDYANTLKDDVKWDAAAGAAGSVGGFSFGFSAAFSASSQYQTMSKGYTQEESQYIISSATCCSYKFKHQNGGTLASLDKGFVSDVWNLPEEYDENAYASFVGRYGTHYVQEVAMGSKYAEIDRITTQNMDKLEAIHSDIQHSAEVKACIGLYHASGGGSNQHSTSNQNQNTWENNIASQHIVTLGALPPKDASDGKAWTKAAVNNPQPIEVTLGDISFVLSDVFVSSYVMDPTELQQRKANLEKYMGTYCQRMKSNGALAKYAQCPCDTIDCCHSRDDSDICAMLPFNDFCRKSGVCTGCKDAPAPTSENSKATCGDRVQKYSTSGGMSENDASCRVKSEAPQYCACLQCKKDHNIVEDNAPNTGGWGGSCTCPDGSVYQVGDNDNSCGSLACFGGHSGTCNKWNGAWSHRKVTCQGFTPAATAPPTRNFALIDGGPGSDAELQEVMNPDPTKKLGKVQCCKGRKCTRHNPANSIRRKHCISGYDDKSKVFTLQEAKNACAAIGWSLCTRQEVDAKHCNKHGCGNDSEYVWVLETNGAEDAVARMSPVEESEVAESSGCSKWTLFWADCKVDSDCCPEKSWTCGRDNKCIWHDLSPNAWSKCDIYIKAANWIASKVADEAACTTEAMAAYHRRDVLKKLDPSCSHAAPSPASVSNCEGYLSYKNLPQDWCSKLDQWALCGIGDGRVYGSGYGCTFKRYNDQNYCKPLNSGNECNQFQLKNSEKSMMVATTKSSFSVADNKVNVALGFFAVIGGCAILYNAVQMVSKYACEPKKWTPIGEEPDV